MVIPGQREITRADLVAIIQLLDKKMECATPLTAIGGTALTLLEMKSSSRDVDFISKLGSIPRGLPRLVVTQF